MMRIGLFTDCYFPNIGGAEIMVHNMAKTFCRLGHEAVVMAPKRKGLQKMNLSYTLVPYLSFPGQLGLKTLREAAALVSFQKRFCFDVINIHKTYAGYSAGKIKAFLGTPVVIVAHGGDIQKDLEIGYGRRIQPAWEKKIAYAVQKADALIAISRKSVDCFRDLGASKEKIYRIANGVDIELFSKKAELNREGLGVKENDRLILAVGNYRIIKGYETLVRSIALLSKKVENFKLLIVGKKMESFPHPLVRELGVEDKILFIQEQKGKQSQNNLNFPNDFLLSLYKNTDVFVSSSIMEGFSLVCIEAMAAGLPLVLTRCPGNEDVLEKDGRGGYYVPVGDAEAMANKIAMLLADQGKRNEFSTFNREYARQKYSLETIAEEYLELFEELVRTRRN